MRLRATPTLPVIPAPCVARVAGICGTSSKIVAKANQNQSTPEVFSPKNAQAAHPGSFFYEAIEDFSDASRQKTDYRSQRAAYS